MSDVNMLSFDIEEFANAEACAALAPEKRAALDRGRVVANTRRILEILGKAGAKATFFVLGRVAERHPDLVREIDAGGHEVASHGNAHVMITRQTPEEFRADVREAKQRLEMIVQKPVVGYRAPTFSVVPATKWAIDILKEERFAYDSSVFPIQGHDRYGYPDAPIRPYTHENGLAEFPMSVHRVGTLRVPFAGGGYFRLFPYWLTKRWAASNNRRGLPVMVYLHPWELDAEQEKADLPFLSAYRTYNHIGDVPERLRRMLGDFRFTPIRDYARARNLI